MGKKLQINWQAVLTVFLVVGVLVYLSFQVYRSVFSGVDTEMAVVHRVYKSIDAEGLIYRSEKLVKNPSKGYPYFVVSNGTRVAKDSKIASVYSDANSGQIGQEIEEIDQQIQIYKSIMADGGANRLTLESVNEQTFDAITRLVRNTETGTFMEVADSQVDLLSLLSKKQSITGKSIDFSAKIKELESERSKLKSSYRSPNETIKAPVAGYFSNEADGYETILKTDDLSSLTVEKLNENLEMDVESSDAYCGKIVSGYEWYIACVLPESYYDELGKGTSLALRMSFVLDEAVPVTVAQDCKKDGKGNMVVVFRCDYMSPELATVRQEPIQILLKEYTGLKVPKRAIVFNENDEQGVYIRSGNVVSFRKIEQLFSEPADYVICTDTTEDPTKKDYLRMYDDIIVGGKELYDGKIIN